MEKNMKILIAGTFDLFHKGHEAFITSALQNVTENSEFHVIIAKDINVQKIKSKKPEDSENIRQKNIINFLKILTKNTVNKCKNIKTFVHIGDETDFLKIPKQINPDIICFGYDQQIPNKLKFQFTNCEFKTMKSYFPEKYKTSKMLKNYIPGNPIPPIKPFIFSAETS